MTIISWLVYYYLSSRDEYAWYALRRGRYIKARDYPSRKWWQTRDLFMELNWLMKTIKMMKLWTFTSEGWKIGCAKLLTFDLKTGNDNLMTIAIIAVSLPWLKCYFMTDLTKCFSHWDRVAKTLVFDLVACVPWFSLARGYGLGVTL